MPLLLFFHGATAPSGPRPPHYRWFTITLRQTIRGGIPLDDWPVRRTKLYLKTKYWQGTSMFPAVFEPTNPAIERPQTARPLTAVLYHCCCHYILPMCQTSVPDSKLLQDRKVQFVFVCFQYGVLLGQHFYIPVNRKRYFIMTWLIILANMFVFSSIWRAILANILSCPLKRRFISVKMFVFQSTRYAIFANTFCFIPIGRVILAKILLFHYDIACYFREHLFCSTWHDLSLWRTLWRFILIWQNYSSEYLLCSDRHAFLFQENFSRVLIIKAKKMHYFSSLFW